MSEKTKIIFSGLTEDFFNIYIISGECLRLEGNDTISTNQHSRCTSFSLFKKENSRYFYLTEEIKNKIEKKCLYWTQKFWVRSCKDSFGRLDTNFLKNLGAINDKGNFRFEIKDVKKNQEIVIYLKSKLATRHFCYFFRVSRLS